MSQIERPASNPLAGRAATDSSIGIVGAGQLSRMLIEAAIPLGLNVRLLAAAPQDGAALVSPHVLVGPPASYEPLSSLAALSTVLTFDHELVDVPVLERLEREGHTLRPSSKTIAIAQDKGRQRTLFERRGLPVPAYAFARSTADVLAFGRDHGWPVVLKAVRGGYDGRGVWMVADANAAEQLVEQLLGSGIELLVEKRVAIEQELAVLVARRPGGQTAVYPAVETVQVEGICREILAPAAISDSLAAEARRLALAVADAVDACGILALELFLVGGTLIINEIAARPHNSGHYTIEGSITSQFENHLRAILDWPLGATDLVRPAVATVNVLGMLATGDLLANLPAALAIEGVRVHLYGKEPRPGRKIGHVTALGQEHAEARRRAAAAAAILAGATPAEGH